jgi:hypothetical protein
VRGGADESTARAAFARPAPGESDSDERFELTAVAARGFRPPGFLRIAPSADADDAADAPEPTYEGLRQTWSLLYRNVAETGPRRVLPHSIYLLGVNPPTEASPEELDLFNEFYTGTHLPEVAERRHALRAVRYELLREVRPPHRGAPRFLAVYEVDERSAANRRHSGPAYSAGPDVWQRHTTPWRLWYSRLDVRQEDTAASTAE